MRRKARKTSRRTRRDPSMTPRRAEVLLRALGANRRVSNRAKSRLGIYEFMRDSPDKIFAYYRGDARVGDLITNGMGGQLGVIIHRGKESRPFGGKVVSIRMKAINGFTYAGRCNLSSGTYCRLKKVKGRR